MHCHKEVRVSNVVAVLMHEVVFNADMSTMQPTFLDKHRNSDHSAAFRDKMEGHYPSAAKRSEE